MIRLISLALVLCCTVAFATSDNLKRAQFTSSINNKEPVDNVSTLNISTPKFYFYTDLRNCNGCKITHTWLLDGKQQAVRNKVAKSNRYRWWTGMSPNGLTGVWSVRVHVDGVHKLTKSLSYLDGAQRVAPVQHQLQQNLDYECRRDIVYFEDMIERYPDDDYFKFKLDKVQKRCY